jgi:pyruvate/2-oxoglutarate dehydrogenase complex dihydrolipoamide acyltransferase (E2) component
VSVELRIPDDALGDSGEGVISAWLAHDGERVEQGAVVAELMEAKAVVELVAPASGVLRIQVAAEQALRRGMVVATID